MKHMDLDKYQLAWKEEKLFQAKDISEQEILHFTKSTSKIDGQYKKVLGFDVVLKSIFIVALIGLCFMVRETTPLIIVFVLISITVLGLLWQLRIYKQTEKISAGKGSLKETLQKVLSFLNHTYSKSLFVNALSSTLFLLIGSLYYLQLKYGKIPPMAFDDGAVMTIGILLSYGLSAIAYIMQTNFQIKQLETCLSQIEEDTLNESTLKTFGKNRLKNLIKNGIALITGVILLLYVIYNVIN